MRNLLVASLIVISLAGYAQESNPYIPEIHGTIRAKYEPPIDKCRFEIRNARLSVDGKVIPQIRN